MFQLGAKSLEKLKGVHPDLVKVVQRAIQLSEIDFTVIEGLRTLERQKQLVAAKASKTMKSRHLDGHAVDLAGIVDGQVVINWHCAPIIAKAMKAAAAELKVPLEWGGEWASFPDGPHFQLPWHEYPSA